VAGWLGSQGLVLRSVVHPAAVVAPSATIGAGTLVMPGAVVNAEARIGANAIVNSGAIVEHDCEVGEGVHIAPGAVLCGGARRRRHVDRRGRRGAAGREGGRMAADQGRHGGGAGHGEERVMQLGQDQLAIEGGRPVRAAPFPPWPVFGQDEIDAAGAVLASGRVNYWTGEECRRFEEEFAAHTARATPSRSPTARWRWNWPCMRSASGRATR
jgi:hypothetical protein